MVAAEEGEAAGSTNHAGASYRANATLAVEFNVKKTQIVEEAVGVADSM